MEKEKQKGNFYKPKLYISVNIEEYVYEKVKKRNVVVNVPQEPVYFQEYNHRIIIGLFPQFATWSDNSIYEIKIVEITDDKIQIANLNTSPEELSRISIRAEQKNKSQEDFLKEKVLTYLKNFFNDDRVSKDVFLGKYNVFLEKINNISGK